MRVRDPSTGAVDLVYQEKEITEHTFLCNRDGTLNKDSISWARNPIITSNLSGHFLRRKKWNYWCVFGREAMFSATNSHLDYAAVCFVEYETKDYIEETIIIPLGRKCNMPEDIQESLGFIHKKTWHIFQP
ncbi:DUF2804 family protein [Virgibacillus oceani]